MKQSPSQQCKQAGLNSLAEVSRMTNVSAQTLTNWCKSKPQLFAIVLQGCVLNKFKLSTAGIEFKQVYSRIANDRLNEMQKITEKEYYDGSN